MPRGFFAQIRGFGALYEVKGMNTMNLIHKLLLAGFALHTLNAQIMPSAHAPLVQVSIDSVNVDSLGSDHANLSVKTSVVVARNVTVTRVRFEGMRLAEIPVFLNPVEERMELTAGVPKALPAIPFTIYYRDLDSLQSLEPAIERGEVVVTGHARADLDLGLLDRIVVRQWNGRSDLPIRSVIPIAVPGGAVGRAAAVATLRTAEHALNMAGSALNALRGIRSDWTRDLNATYAPGLVLAEARYAVLLRDGRRIDLTVPGLGFRVSERQFMVTGEMVEPWKYDADVALLLDLHEATLVRDSYDLVVWPGDGPSGYSARRLSEGEIRIEHGHAATETVIVPHNDKRIRVHVAKRDSRDNMAILSFANEQDWRTPIQSAPDAIKCQQTWERLAIFRMGDQGKLSVIFVSARRKGDRLVFETPVDENAFGSPLIAREGVVAMVQEERSALPVIW
jgi:hypothetical protein